jgi:hypothetical protein
MGSVDISPESEALITDVDTAPEVWALICNPPETMDLMSDVDIPPESWVLIG